MTSIILFWAGVWMFGFGWMIFEFKDDIPLSRSSRVISLTGLVIAAFAINMAIWNWFTSVPTYLP